MEGSRSKLKIQSSKSTKGDVEQRGKKFSTQHSALSKNQLQQVEQRVKEIESKIPQMEAELAKLTLEMSSPQTIADHAELQKVSEKYQQKEKQIQGLYQEWEKLESEI